MDSDVKSSNENSTIYHMEILERGSFCPKVGPNGFEVMRVDPPRPEMNRDFYVRVGKAWRWTDRLAWSLHDWSEYVDREILTTWVGWMNGTEIGYFELESQAEGNVQIAYFGLLPEFIGQGLGGAFLSAAIQSAWDMPGTRRVWVHTCTEDHPNALENYRKRGFQVFKEEHLPLKN